MPTFELATQVIQIPAPESGADFEFSARMSSVKYWFRFKWNTRLQSWSFDLLDPAKNPIKLGISLTMGNSLIKGLTDRRRPPGILLCVDAGGSNQPPGRYDLGKRVKLTYVLPLPIS